MPYKALKSLGVAERLPQFDPRDLRPDLDDDALLEDMANFFTEISGEFLPLNKERLPFTYNNVKRTVSVREVLDRLVEMKKPKSSVSIDPPSRFINSHADLFAPMLTVIINFVLQGGEWPRLWSEEEVSIIPKSSHVEDYNGCRNISCTSVFSKLCETFMMDCLHEEVTLIGPQFRGLKGSGPPHLLIELLTKTLEQLDDNRAVVNLISLDFQKAFNRMDHSVCINALASRGASNQTLKIVTSFLSGRSMRIKLGDKFSSSRSTPGGAPQGTKAGNFLFCASVDGIDRDDYLERVRRPPLGEPQTQANTTSTTHVIDGRSRSLLPPVLSSVDNFHVGNGGPEDKEESIVRYGLAESATDTFG